MNSFLWHSVNELAGSNRKPQGLCRREYPEHTIIAYNLELRKLRKKKTDKYKIPLSQHHVYLLVGNCMPYLLLIIEKITVNK